MKNKPIAPATFDGPSLAEVVSELRAIRHSLDSHGAAVLNREAAATYLGISTATLERLTSKGIIRSIKVSEGRVGWMRSTLDSYLAVLLDECEK